MALKVLAAFHGLSTREIRRRPFFVFRTFDSLPRNVAIKQVKKGLGKSFPAPEVNTDEPRELY